MIGSRSREAAPPGNASTGSRSGETPPHPQAHQYRGGNGAAVEVRAVRGRRIGVGRGTGTGVVRGIGKERGSSTPA